MKQVVADQAAFQLLKAVERLDMQKMEASKRKHIRSALLTVAHRLMAHGRDEITLDLAEELHGIMRDPEIRAVLMAGAPVV